RNREIRIEGNDLRAAFRQLVHHLCVGVARNRKCADLLERILLQADDHDIVIVRAWSAQNKPRIQRAQFDIVEKAKAGMLALGEIAVIKEDQRNGSNQKGNEKVSALDR